MLPELPEVAMESSKESFWRIVGRRRTRALKKFEREQRDPLKPLRGDSGVDEGSASKQIEGDKRERKSMRVWLHVVGAAREGEQRRDEPRREDQGEQQAPAPQGPVLPLLPPVDYGVFMQGLVQAMQTQAHTQAALQAQLEAQQAQERADVWWSSLLRTRFEDGAVEEGEMEQYLEEKKASQKRPAAPFQRQERKKAAFQSSQHPVASGSSQVPSQRSPSGKKECPHCGRAHGSTKCWKLAGKCLKCGSSEHRIKDCPRLQQGGVVQAWS
ncbi:hypothetical protein Taro_006911 [Colocasia esculenta]|uniref:CCHC-type domain-containing protein n=1 Tax=Colocasia esculenta TaxID=4460 RepID=A0A843TXF3_COLES|nr:hypothetical protein [Colocasia esculenta]